MSLRAADFVLGGETIFMMLLRADCSPHWRAAQVSGKNKNALAMT